MLEKLLQPIVVGIAVAGLGYLVQLMVPLIEQMLQLRSIRGQWNTTFLRGGEEFHENVDVHQCLHWVWGTITLALKGTMYRFRGTVRSGVMVAHYEIVRNRAKLDRGAFTVMLNNKGDTMEGKYCWTDDSTDDVSADNYKWNRCT